MVACVLQEQLAPILETIREHSRLLDWHSALLNHSTIMNRYNAGKLEDLRDLQTNVNYKLQFHIDPEDRKRPTYRNPQPTPAPKRAAGIAASTVTSSPKRDDALPPSERPPVDKSCPSSVSPASRSRDCAAASPSGAPSSAASAPDPPARQPTPVFEPPARNPPSPPTTRRGLRRERAHDETPDPMWNSSRKIDLSAGFPVPAPLPLRQPPSAPPPVCADGVVAMGRSETKDMVVVASQPSQTPQPSETAAAKKRKREDDPSSCGSGEALAGSSSQRDAPERKRKKKEEEEDTNISTERLPIPESFLRLARLNVFGEPSFEERRCEVEQMRFLKNLFRGGRAT